MAETGYADHNRRVRWAVFLLFLIFVAPLRAQIDPEKRQLLQFGFDDALSVSNPLGGYAFYYLNQPGVPSEHAVLRLAVAPVYLDAELGLRGALGPATDLAFGFAGGGFAESHNEIRRGDFIEEESFTGHGGGLSASVYHRFNPGGRIPLSAVLRGGFETAVYKRRSETHPDFVLPLSHSALSLRAGLRLGGRAPELEAPKALELSVWYEGRLRADSGVYGFAGERRLERDSHFLWGRALFSYASLNTGRDIGATLTAGTSVTPDRLNAWRLGGGLRLGAEFPLALPGYMDREISAERFAVLDGRYQLLFGPGKRLSAGLRGAAAYVDYLPGMGQSGSLHGGIGALLDYKSRSGSWKVVLGYGYGIAAPRPGGRGGHSLSLMAQCNLRARPDGVPTQAPQLDRPFWRFLRKLLP